MANFCSNCGIQVSESNQFCPGCGQPLQASYVQMQQGYGMQGQEGMQGQPGMPMQGAGSPIIYNVIQQQPRQRPQRKFAPWPFVGLGLGILAFCLLNYFTAAVIVSVAALVFSIIGAKHRYRLNGFGICGIFLSLIALLMALTVGMALDFQKRAQDSLDDANVSENIAEYAESCEEVED